MTDLDQPFLDFAEFDPHYVAGITPRKAAPREWAIGDPLYLSRVQLDRRDPQVSRIVGDAQMLKSWVIKPFGDTARDQNGMLYSVEIVNNVVLLYVQSHTAQNWWFTAGSPHVTVTEPKRIEEQIDHLRQGAAYKFRVAVAAYDDVAAPDRPDRNGRPATRRRHLELPQQQVGWLNKRLSGAARIEWISGTVTGTVEGVQQDVEGMPKNNRIAFKRTTISGKLTVHDPEALAMIRRRGIGPEKAYGCGLLHLQVSR